MAKIHLLDSFVYNRISAGEVVERPSSVVKELVENSLDAGADELHVTIRGGGIEEITISDNGSGIAEEDIKAAFLPHATSKIKSVEDLDSIATLGFRGEALASISSVSKVELSSKTEGMEYAISTSYDNGVFSDYQRKSANVGTTISVRNLFYNTPARLKFLKTPKSEESQITNLMFKLIVSNPTVRFTYIADGKVVFSSTGMSQGSAIAETVGHETASKLLYGEKKSDLVKVSGYISDPTFTKNNRNTQVVTVNGRVIQNQTLQTALYRGYGSSLMKGAHPLLFVNVEVDVSELDVNVTPSKTDVRFVDNDKIFRVVYRFVQEVLDRHYNEVQRTFSESETQSDKPVETHTAFDFFRNFKFDNEEVQLSDSSSNVLVKDLKYTDNTPIDYRLSDSAKRDAKKENEQYGYEVSPVEKDENNYIDVKDYKIIGQVFSSYILVERNDEILFIDTHAACERINFDRLVAAFDKDNAVSQYLLLPEVLEFDFGDYEVLCALLPSLRRFGFEIEEFGDNSVKIDAVPEVLTEMNIERFLRDVVSDNAMVRNLKPSDFIRDKLASSACKHSIKANTAFNEVELNVLVKRIIQDNAMPLQCPHGRPTFFVMTKLDMEKRFKRKV